MKKLLTPKQVARAIGVSESSLKRWCDRELLPTVRTAGGHRRIAAGAVLQFLRERGKTLAEPEVLGLPSVTGTGPVVFDRQAALMQDALLSANEELCRRIVFDLYLAGQSAVDICDRVITSAFHAIGDRWECGDIEVYQERRACEICMHSLYELRSVLPTPSEPAPYALGGTLTGDVYRLPTMMVEMTLREAGWSALSYGNMLPAATFCAAISTMKPRLVWLSSTHIESKEQFFTDYAAIYRSAVEHGAAVVVGGQALSEELRREMQYSAYCDNLRHLVSFAATIFQQPKRPAADVTTT